jgi:hypothetical protein
MSGMGGGKAEVAALPRDGSLGPESGHRFAALPTAAVTESYGKRRVEICALPPGIGPSDFMECR